jgi:acetate kinase
LWYNKFLINLILDMDKKYLIVNTGSASKKFSFYIGEQKVYNAHFEMEDSLPIVTESIEDKKEKRKITKKEYDNAIRLIVESLICHNLIKDKDDINSVGIRIVAPGEYFLTNRLIDKEYLKKAKEALKKVPLHLGPALKEIENIKKYLGPKIAIYGVSDSAFHSTIPEETKFYAIPISDSRRLGLQMFGYHGISVQSVVSKAEKLLGKLPEKTVVCHLGGGGSVTAVKEGKSINTSMGFTPLEGLVMATRVGDIDAGAVLYLSEKLKKSPHKLEDYFNNKCGLLGLSGKSSDIRELLIEEEKGHSESALALKLYANRIKEYIGKMSASLGGIDLLVLAGTVGERSFIMRQRICQGLDFLGINIDDDLNNKSEGVEVDISKPESRVRVLIVKTDETEEIAKETLRLSK